jgi:4-hydroxy-tetrahydrodipicolinate reductase
VSVVDVVDVVDEVDDPAINGMVPVGIVVIGARGRLGRLVLDEVQARIGVVLVGAVGRTGPSPDDAAAHIAVDIAVGSDLGQVLEHVAARWPTQRVVVVDVATAGATAAHAAAAAAAGVPYVCASTGLADVDDVALTAAAALVPVLQASNLSPGAHLVALLAAQAARIMGPDADCEIVELHHHQKKDAPSGTALMLAEAVVDARAAQCAERGIAQRRVHARDGQAPRQPGDIGVVAVRGGDVVGEHTVMFFADGERVELTHKVSDRRIFAKGALDAATFLVGRAAGRYRMSDVLAARLSSG